jgi:hypothetical protein
MHVGMVSYYYFPGKLGGAEHQCRLISEQLVRQGVKCTVFTARKNKSWQRREMLNGVQIVRLPTFRHDSSDTDEPSPLSPNEEKGERSFKNFIARNLADFLSSLDVDLFLLALSIRILSKSVDILHVHSSTGIAGFCSWLGRCCSGRKYKA